MNTVSIVLSGLFVLGCIAYLVYDWIYGGAESESEDN